MPEYLRQLIHRDPAAKGRRGLHWITPPDWPLDMGGPSDRSFDRMGPGFSSLPIIGHLGNVAAKLQQKLAISDEACQFTYAELHARVLVLARAITATVPEGHAVGLLLNSSVWYPIAMLACMTAGRPAIPLNCRDPVQRTADIARNARISAVIGQDAGNQPEWITEQNVQWIDASRSNGPALASSSFAPVSVDAPAMVLYTSGSTGQPKGVVNSQRALLQRVQQYVDACHINADDVFMPLSGPTTIAGCREMLSALLSGATLHVADVETTGLRGIRRQIRAHGVTIAYIVPALLRAIAGAGDSDDFQSLRIVRVGGEKVLWTDIAIIRRLMPRSCLIQISYLSTETTGSQWFLPPDMAEQKPAVPAGYLLPGIEFAVVDEDGVSVDAGDVGELVIKSPFVTLGYWDNGCLVPAAVDQQDRHHRIFSTGDLVSVDSRGLLTVIGRKGRQLKINGRRVEPAELELVVRRLPFVRDTVAIVTDTNELVAFAVPGAEARASFTADIREAIRQALPSALHPTRMHQIAEIPRLPGGKVDVAKLKQFDRDERETPPSPSRLPSAGELMKAKCAVDQVWSRILGKAKASGRWDEAGGDSLKLLRCVMELEELLGRELDMKSFTIDMDATEMIRAAAMEGIDDAEQDDAVVAPTVIMLPGSMGYGPSLAAFGTELGEVANVIPIRYPDLNCVLSGRGSIQAMADAAIEQINVIQPRGDIRLLGYSLGGGVGFEVAARLIAMGRSVKFFGILDTNVGGSESNYRETFARTLQRIRSHRMTVYRMLCRAVAKCVVRLHGEAGFCRILDAAMWNYFQATRFMLRLELEEILRMREFGRWVAGSKGKLPIKGTLFLCNRHGASPHLGWDPLFAKLEVIPIAGGHLDLVIEPHLAINGPVIKRAVASSYA